MGKNQNPALRICFFISMVLLLSLCYPRQACAQTAKTYEEAIQKGNKELKQNKLLDAKAYFQMALQLRPGDKKAQQLIDETVTLLKKQGSHKAGYYKLIDSGDDYLAKGALDLAKLSYEKALKIVPGDAYAEKKIKEVNQKQIEEKQKESAFNSKIKEGTHFVGIQQFDKAISLFKDAQKIFPKRKIAAQKIALATRLKSEYQHRQQSAAREIKTAQRYLLIKNYISALTHLQKADSFTPGSTAILAKINQIEPLARRQKAYNEKANEGDKLYVAKNYMAAKMKYQEAEALWPGNSYPKDMINRINATLEAQKAHLNQNYLAAVHQADSLFKVPELDNARAEYNLALNLKPNEAYPKEQIKKIDALLKKELAAQQARYRQIIHQGDSLFNIKQYLASKKIFTKALTLRPNDVYPQKKLKEIAQALLKQAAQEKIEVQYQELIASGNQFFSSQNWNLSLEKFQMALQIKPTETYPKTKIASIRKILADSAQQRKINAAFARQMQLGNEFKTGKQWIEAKKSFQKALSLKPHALEPTQDIAQIDSILQQIANQKKIDIAYRKAFASGDSLLIIKSYQPALKAFQEAATLKPQETAPKQKIKAINDTLAAIARQKQLDEKYLQTIVQADSLLKQKSYELALKDYKTASGLKQNESYPKEKIKEINNILLQLEKERDQRYQKAIAEADGSFKSKDYQEALSQYENALSIKPEETYPKKQIKQCQLILAATLEKRKKQYNQEITTADRFYHQKALDQAIDAYKKAHHILPGETYPTEMIHKITKYISDNAIEDIVKQNVTLKPNQTKRFSFKPLPVAVRQSNYVLIKATNLNGNSFNIIFTFGKGSVKNGGFVVRVPEGKGTYDFIIRVGTQYKWFSEDNDWMSVYSDNNPLQINLIRISKSD